MSIKIENEQIRKILKNAPPDIARRIMETFWNELGNVPVNDDGIIQESFLWWPKGTDREDIWHWFDEKYPGGVKKLMHLEDGNG